MGRWFPLEVNMKFPFFGDKGRFGDCGEWIPVDSSLWGELWDEVVERSGEEVTVIDGDPRKDLWVDVQFKDGFILQSIDSAHLKLA
jgi:hypothetical protein